MSTILRPLLSRTGVACYLYGQYLTSDGAVIVSLRPAPPSPEINVGITILIFFVFGEAPLKLSSNIDFKGEGEGTHTAI